ncbi:MAG: hypothetical protein JRJ39_01065 [Deltaproteobacteria bacterium]|nr:hypothetical protein [Deltaproteobacteria bacterium]
MKADPFVDFKFIGDIVDLSPAFGQIEFHAVHGLVEPQQAVIGLKGNSRGVGVGLLMGIKRPGFARGDAPDAAVNGIFLGILLVDLVSVNQSKGRNCSWNYQAYNPREEEKQESARPFYFNQMVHTHLRLLLRVNVKPFLRIVTK